MGYQSKVEDALRVSGMCHIKSFKHRSKMQHGDNVVAEDRKYTFQVDPEKSKSAYRGCHPKTRSTHSPHYTFEASSLNTQRRIRQQPHCELWQSIGNQTPRRTCSMLPVFGFSAPALIYGLGLPCNFFLFETMLQLTQLLCQHCPFHSA